MEQVVLAFRDILSRNHTIVEITALEALVCHEGEFRAPELDVDAAVLAGILAIGADSLDVNDHAKFLDAFLLDVVFDFFDPPPRRRFLVLPKFSC